MNKKTTKGTINYYEDYDMDDAAMAGYITLEEYLEWAADDKEPDYSFIRNTDHEDYMEDCMEEYKEICEELPFDTK